MSSETTQPLDTAEFFRRVIPFDSGPLDDEETAAAADALLASLEDDDGDPSAW